ncbi:hypothetical protein GJ744_001972 [Endocarpon pusillum]|uniref:Uncharacterized protein n=1 Tax=Endocarpon pusillum TaxID=364733 RepID=A0A8H7ACP0_9EURO|nr:hypothetical protein GJ744_001972 [Endocarpon pusillum]
MRREVSAVFACSTAGSLVAISFFNYPFREAKTGSKKSAVEFNINYGKIGILTRKSRLELLGIQDGNGEDPFGWREKTSMANLWPAGLSLPAVACAGTLTSS